MPGGRPKGALSKKTVARLQSAGDEIAATKRMDVVRAKTALSDLVKTAVGFTAHYQQQMLAFEQTQAGVPEPEKVPDYLVDRFMMGLNTAIRAAAALAPYQDPKLTAIKVAMSPFDIPDAPKTIEGKATKLDLPKDAAELARIYASAVRAA